MDLQALKEQIAALADTATANNQDAIAGMLYTICGSIEQQTHVELAMHIRPFVDLMLARIKFYDRGVN